jgi:hypothetical protein
MAYVGYLSIGLEDSHSGAHSHEILNNNRVLAYTAATGAAPWLLNCDLCTDINPVLPGGGGYDTPAADPAPWYNPRNLDAAGFMGVLGLEITGAEDSTRKASVVTALRGGGVIGRTYEGPRTLVVRALAVADAECSLQYGLRWLNEQFLFSDDPCTGDPLTFFECCPEDDCETDDRPVGPCWPDTYAELAGAPSCSPDWWPTTYSDLLRGPPYLRTNPPTEGDWCDWVGVYREMQDWLPPWNCCTELNVIPRMKQFADARVIEGPTVLSRPTMTSGALAEIEFTIAAADPTATRMAFYWSDTFVE